MGISPEKRFQLPQEIRKPIEAKEVLDPVAEAAGILADFDFTPQQMVEAIRQAQQKRWSREGESVTGEQEDIKAADDEELKNVDRNMAAFIQQKERERLARKRMDNEERLAAK